MHARIVPLLILCVLLPMVSGCVTMFVEGSLEEYQPTDILRRPRGAWVVPGDGKREAALVIRFEEHEVWAPARMPFEEPLRVAAGPVAAFYSLDTSCSVPPRKIIPSEDWRPPRTARPIALVLPPDESENPGDTVSVEMAGSVYRVSRTRRQTSIPLTGVQVLLFPVTLGADVGLLPVYLIGGVVVFAFS